MNNSQLPQGYKLTEAGVIPEDWHVETISQLIYEQALLGHLDGNHGELYPRSHEFKSYGVPYVGANDFSEGIVKFENCKFLSHKRATQFRKGVAKDGDILFAHNATVGPVALLRTNEPFVILSTTATYFRCNSEKLSNLYLKVALQSKQFVQQYQSVMAQSTRFQVPITTQRKLRLVIPPLHEQRSIATVLSDVDELLGVLDRLIAKKRDLKQATMQQLLTGKNRLPGFGEGTGCKQTEIGEIPEDWDFKVLGFFIHSLDAGVSVNSSDTNNVDSEEASILKTSCVLNGKFFPRESKKIIPQDLERAKFNPRKNSIIISRMNTPALVGECGYVEDDYPNLFLPDRLWMTRPEENTYSCPKWLADILSFKPFSLAIKDTATGTSNSMKNISKGSFLSIKIPYPSKQEQTAIATILSDMDNSIAALEQRRDKTRALKQAMMQELLTGRIRLV